MSSSHSPQVIGAPIVTVAPKYHIMAAAHFPLPEHQNLTSTNFLLNTKVKLTLLVSHSVGGEGRVVLDSAEGPGSSIEFSKSSSQRLDALVGASARDDIGRMLSNMHVPETLRSGDVVDAILEGGRRLSEQRPTGRNVHSVMCLDVNVEAFVDKLPIVNENDNNSYNNDDDNDNDQPIIPDEDVYVDGDGDRDEVELDSIDDYSVWFEPASNESIKGLEKIRVLSEKAVNCSVCLEDVTVGSEAIRLSCSHHYHGDCIVKWLRKSKFCPVCPFELPT